MSGSGYTRQSAANITSGQPVASTPVNNEFNQLVAAFDGGTGHYHDGTTGNGPPLGPAALDSLTGTSTGFVAAASSTSFAARTITGTSLQIDVTNGTGVSGNPTISIDAGYVGQTSLTTLGTITTGTWHGTAIATQYGGLGGNFASSTGVLGISSGTVTAGVVSPTYGGTGVNNGTNTLTLSGGSNLTLTLTATTSVTLPTSGTLVNSGVATLSSLSSIGTITAGTWNATVINPTYGGTGVNNGSNNITLGGSITTSGGFTTSGSFPLTLTATGSTNVTLPTSGTLVNTAVTSLLSLSTVGTIASGTWQATPIALAYGGTNANLTASNGGIVYSGSSAFAVLAGTSTAGQILRSGSSAAPSWSTATYPATTTGNQLLYSSSSNVIAGLATAANGVLVTSSGSVPSISSTIPAAVVLANGVTATTQSAGNNSTNIATTAYVDRGSSGASVILLATATASTSSTVQFTNIPGGYDQYVFRFTYINCSASASFRAQYSSNNGSSYASANYPWAAFDCNSAVTGGSQGNGGDSFLNLLYYSPSSFSGTMTVYNLGSSSLDKGAIWDFYANDGNAHRDIGGGVYTGDTNAVNAIQFFMSSGTMLSGNFALYGIRNS